MQRSNGLKRVRSLYSVVLRHQHDGDLFCCQRMYQDCVQHLHSIKASGKGRPVDSHFVGDTDWYRFDVGRAGNEIRGLKAKGRLQYSKKVLAES